MKLIIAGGRDYEFIGHDVDRLNKIKNVSEVVSGGASGADACGEKWANDNSIPIVQYPADWKTHGKSAGPKRNRKMAEYADAVALFPGGRGTKSMLKEAIKSGLIIYNFQS